MGAVRSTLIEPNRSAIIDEATVANRRIDAATFSLSHGPRKSLQAKRFPTLLIVQTILPFCIPHRENWMLGHEFDLIYKQEYKILGKIKQLPSFLVRAVFSNNTK